MPLQSKPLAEIALFRNGKALTPSLYIQHGRYPVFGSNGTIARTHSVLNPSPVVVIGRVGAYCGSVYYVNQASWVTDNAIIAEPKTGNDTRFLYYLLKSLDLNRTAIGSAQPLLTQSGLNVITVAVPSYSEQRAIAAILGALDDKIELNRKMNETLEQTARAIFQSWFVDFDPVRAKAEGRRPFGMDDATAALFPDSFEDSPLGRNPKGWRVGVIGDIAQNLRRGINAKDIPQGTPYIALEHMPRKCIALSEWATSDDVESNKFEFRIGDILFGKLRPYFHKVGVAPLNGVCSTDIVVITPKTQSYFGLTLCHVSSVDLINDVDAASTGTKMPRTNWDDIAKFRIVLPSSEVADRFSQTAKTNVDAIRANIMQSRILVQLRDTLLPKLMSGELRVKDAEKLAGERV